MDRIALIADVHGNLPALEAALADIRARGIARIWCLGDTVGKGPSSAQALDIQREVCARSVYGNWDRAILTWDQPMFRWFRERLGRDRLDWMAAQPEALFLTMSGRRIKLLHGRPTVPECLFPSSDGAQKDAVVQAIDGGACDVVGMADAHQPYVFMHGGRWMFNTGSVGNACDGVSEAAYAILSGDMARDGAGGECAPGPAVRDGDARGEEARGGEEAPAHAPFSIEICRVPYDRERAIRDALAVPDLPSLDAYINEVRTGRYSRFGLYENGPRKGDER